MVETARRIRVILFDLKTFQTNLFLIVERDRKKGVGGEKRKTMLLSQSLLLHYVLHRR